MSLSGEHSETNPINWSKVIGDLGSRAFAVYGSAAGNEAFSHSGLSLESTEVVTACV
jgi:hypothetical protein